MRKIVTAALLSFTVACAATQAAAPCIIGNLAADEATFKAIIDDATLTTEQKIEKITIELGPQAVTCVLAAKKSAMRHGAVDAGSAK